VMSAPAMKVRPRGQHDRLHFRSAIALFMHSKMSAGTAALSAFTGGLLTVTMAIMSWTLELDHVRSRRLSLMPCSYGFLRLLAISHLRN